MRLRAASRRLQDRLEVSSACGRASSSRSPTSGEREGDTIPLSSAPYANTCKLFEVLSMNLLIRTKLGKKLLSCQQATKTFQFFICSSLTGLDVSLFYKTCRKKWTGRLLAQRQAVVRAELGPGTRQSPSRLYNSTSNR